MPDRNWAVLSPSLAAAARPKSSTRRVRRCQPLNAPRPARQPGVPESTPVQESTQDPAGSHEAARWTAGAEEVRTAAPPDADLGKR